MTGNVNEIHIFRDHCPTHECVWGCLWPGLGTRLRAIFLMRHFLLRGDPTLIVGDFWWMPLTQDYIFIDQSLKK